MAEAALLTLLSASYYAGSGEGDPSLLTLQFSRPVDPSVYISETVTVIDRQFNQESYQATGPYTMIDSQTVQFELSSLDYSPGSGVFLCAYVAEGHGIVAVDDGELWLGVSNLALPFP